jgi:hypothetical protein
MEKELCNKYYTIKKEMQELRKQQNDLKKQAVELEVKIKEYLIENKEDSIVTSDCQISIYEKKVKQTFKKESIKEVLTKELKNEQKASELTDSILNNEKTINTDCIKIKFNKE